MNALPCPFCGSRPTGCLIPLPSYMNVTAVCCSNRDCIASARQVSIETWNTRIDSSTKVESEELTRIKTKYERLEQFVRKARRESDLVVIRAGSPDMKHMIMVPYWFMKDPE